MITETMFKIFKLKIKLFLIPAFRVTTVNIYGVYCSVFFTYAFMLFNVPISTYECIYLYT